MHFVVKCAKIAIIDVLKPLAVKKDCDVYRKDGFCYYTFNFIVWLKLRISARDTRKRKNS